MIKDILKEQGLIIYIEIHLPSFKYKETRYLSGSIGQKILFTKDYLKQIRVLYTESPPIMVGFSVSTIDSKRNY